MLEVTRDLYRRELLKGSTETLLLSLLSGEPMYGYQLVKEIEQRSSGYFHFKEGTLYPALHRLERDGLIAGAWRSSTTGQNRRYHEVTANGRAGRPPTRAAGHRGTAAPIRTTHRGEAPARPQTAVLSLQ